jgi:hypothetical protein
MSDSQTDASRDEPTVDRRRALAVLGAAATAGLAGCGGGGSRSGGDSTPIGGGSAGDPSGTQTAAADGTAGGTSGSGSCPSVPLSYSRYGIAYPANGGNDPLVTVEAPDTESVTVTTANRRWSLEFGPNRNRMSVRPERRDGSLDEYAEQGVRTELTDEYDVPEGARVVAGSNAGEIPALMEVLLPAESGFVTVRIGLTNSENCPEATETIQDRLVNTVELA